MPAPTRFVSLRLRLLGLVALVLLPWLAVIAYTQVDERKEAIASVDGDAKRLIHIITSNQAARIEAARQLLAALARLPQVQADNAPACSAFLAEMLRVYPAYLNLGFAHVGGDVTCSALPLSATINVQDREYFRQAVRTRAFAIGDYQIGRVTHLPAINYAYPVTDAAGAVKGVVYAAQGLSWLTSVLADVEFPQSSVLVVIDRNGTVLARMPEARDDIGKALPEQHLLAILARQGNGGVFRAPDAAGIPRLWAHAPLIGGHGLHATIGVSESVAFADIDRRLYRNLVALALATTIALAAAWYGAKHLLRQVDALVAATGDLAAGDLGARALLVGGRSELQALARAFNGMAETLQARERELRLAEEKTRAAEVELAVTRANMEIAKQIQRSLLPDDKLSLAGMHVAGRCIPAADVGGDYFGYFPRGREGVDSLIGDVSGHGVGAALLMAEARSTFLAERLAEPSAAGILGKLNALLYDDLDRAGHFITACCATFDAGSREVRYANAGHPPAILLRAGEPSWTTLDAEGMPLGTRRTIDFSEVSMTLGRGDMLVFYTDGVTETRNDAGEMLGTRRFGDLLVANRDRDPDEVVTTVIDALHRFSGSRPADDDVTIIVMKVAA